jgi:beta-xylosidase
MLTKQIREWKRFSLTNLNLARLVGFFITGAIVMAAQNMAGENKNAGANQPSPTTADWARGIEGQRKADLGNGTYLNPIFPGDHPDPSILKDGDDYFMTFSSFDSYPGLVIWHSRDLVNWEPIGPALRKNVGSVWAPDLIKCDGKYYIYFPGWGTNSNYVVWANNIKGPWSEPIDLKIDGIDPGHAVGPDGKRYLFLSDGTMTKLADDGLSVIGKKRQVYAGWKYPADWNVESFSLEGPKVVKHGDYYYLINAEGGTAGPPTSHMVIAARAKSLEGPWENSPYNPIVHTWSSAEKWWSKGHGSLVEGPGGAWYIVYHGYEKDYLTLGRQTLLEPIVWTDDGWFKSAGYDVAKPIPKPAADAVQHGFAFSDDFSTNKMGIQWGFYKGNASDNNRYRYENGSLVIQAKGSSPKDCSPLSFVAGDQSYQVDVEVEIGNGTTAGLLLFYNEKLYAGIGFDNSNFVTHRYGIDKARLPTWGCNRWFLRIINDHQSVSMFTSKDGQNWNRYPTGMEVSGYHHNVAGDFLSLRPALYVAGRGEARFRDFRYQALP